MIKGQRVRVEGLEFRGVRVRDRNGAGIRQESGPLTVHDCVFADNENGILSGNIRAMELAISNSTFLDNGNDDGSAHNVYVGAIGRLHVEGCWFGRSRVGHLLKSRARVNVVRYCRLTGEDGSGSYELEFAEGGEALVLGNLIQQGAASGEPDDRFLRSRGLPLARQYAVMAFNTIVNDRVRAARSCACPRVPRYATLVHNLSRRARFAHDRRTIEFHG